MVFIKSVFLLKINLVFFSQYLLLVWPACGLASNLTNTIFDVNIFVTTCCRAPIGQGYGLTETFAGAAFSE